jgi:plastocyanin
MTPLRLPWLRAALFALALPCAGAGAQTAEIVATVTDDHGRPVIDAVVVAVPADGAPRSGARSRDVVIDQVDKEFIPRVLAVLVGTLVAFPNHDNVRHQVYSFSPAKRFDLPLYSGVPAQPIVFDKPGVVVLGCNIHDWMIGYVYVAESPYFAKTDADGKAVIGDLAPRIYRVRVWHPDQEGAENATRRDIDVTHTPRVDAAWQLKLKPEMKIRRAPTGERGGRY